MRSTLVETHQVSGPINGNGNLVKACRENVYKVCPSLAESWTSNSDFTQWTFKIRDNVLWHDGKPFTAEDAKFWAELAYYGIKSGDKSRAPSVFQAAFGEVKTFEVLDGNRFRINLGRPEPLYVDVLMNPRQPIAHPSHLMRPRIERGEVGVSPLDIGLVGVGPYRSLKYEKGSRMQVRRFEGYWEKDVKGRQLPYLDGLDIAIVRDPAAMDAAFRVGRLDGGALGAGHVLTKERQAGYIRDMGDRVWFAEIKATRGGLGFNMLRPGPWQDVRVRKAISLWIDKRAAVEALGGFGFVFPLLAPDSPFTSPDFLTWPGWNPATREQDRATAKRLMAEAGYPNGFPMGFMCQRTNIPTCEFYDAQLAGLGIKLNLQLVDGAGWQEGRQTLNYESQNGNVAARSSVIPEQSDQEMGPFSLAKFNVAKHEDRKVSEFFDRLRFATTFDQRVKVWRELERYYLLEQVYVAPLRGDVSVIPYRSYVKGVFVSGEDVQNNTDFAAVWLEK
jgi:peptide/nickel transport system substrate-binding protein